jgi:hypothetical protein
MKRPSTRVEIARFILEECAKVDFRIGTDGSDLILGPPRDMSRESYRSFQAAILAHADEIIDAIIAKNTP